MLTVTVQELEAKLRSLQPELKHVAEWQVESGLDATGDSAIWVWAYLDTAVPDAYRNDLRDRIRALTKEWEQHVYVRFRTLSEFEEQ